MKKIKALLASFFKVDSRIKSVIALDGSSIACTLYEVCKSTQEQKILASYSTTSQSYLLGIVLDKKQLAHDIAWVLDNVEQEAQVRIESVLLVLPTFSDKIFPLQAGSGGSNSPMLNAVLKASLPKSFFVSGIMKSGPRAFGLGTEFNLLKIFADIFYNLSIKLEGLLCAPFIVGSLLTNWAIKQQEAKGLESTNKLQIPGNSMHVESQGALASKAKEEEAEQAYEHVVYISDQFLLYSTKETGTTFIEVIREEVSSTIKDLGLEKLGVNHIMGLVSAETKVPYSVLQSHYNFLYQEFVQYLQETKNIMALEEEQQKDVITFKQQDTLSGISGIDSERPEAFYNLSGFDIPGLPKVMNRALEGYLKKLSEFFTAKNINLEKTLLISDTLHDLQKVSAAVEECLGVARVVNSSQVLKKINYESPYGITESAWYTQAFISPRSLKHLSSAEFLNLLASHEVLEIALKSTPPLVKGVNKHYYDFSKLLDKRLYNG